MNSSVLLVLFSFVSVLKYGHSQDDGITISLGDRVIPNHGLVTSEDIGLDDTGEDLTVGLKCSTTYADCCTSSTSTARWYFVQVNWEVPTSRTDGRNSFEAKRSRQAVYLFRNKVSTISGIMRCEIPDSNGHLQTKYVGVYNNGPTGILSAGSPGTIQFTMVSEDPVVFTLTFRITGGPATYVTWTRNGVNISSLGDNRYTPSQTVVPNINGTGLYIAGDYDNILTVSGRLSGVYGVNVTNDRTRPAIITPSTITIIDFAHSSVSLNVARSQDLTTISVSWILVSSSFMEYFLSYEVTYTVCDIWSGDCESSVSETITDFTVTQFTVTYLILWANYSFRVSAEFSSHPTVDQFTHILPTTRHQTITILGVLLPEVTSVSELANITSVQVTWNQPEGGLAADEYVVSYRCLNGRNGQCSSFQDEDSVTVRANEQGGPYTTILHLQTYYSVYTCNITARKTDGDLYNTTSFTIVTNSTVPSGAPQNVSISSSNCISTGVTILSWDSVECIHRNGLITHYIISYGQGGDGETNQMNVRVNITDQDEGGSYTVTGIDPTANYHVFKVAAVNEDGVGVFASVSLSQGNDDGNIPSSQASTNAGLTTVIVILFLALVICGVVITIGGFKMKMLHDQLKGANSTSAAKKGNQKDVIYEEPDVLTPTPALELEACPAYELTKID